MDQQVLMFLNSSQPHSTLYNQVAAAPGEGVPKRRRRRRKNKEEANGSGIRKRKLTDEQVHLLETNFGHEHKLESQRKDQIASELGLDPRQVAVWFQNRRARWKNKKLEEEYSKLKSAHENVVVEKCQLEAEVLKLQEQLSEAEKEIERVSKQSNGAAAAAPSCDSFSSSSTMDANPLFLGEFGMEGIESLYNLYESTYIQGMEWVNNYDQ